MTIRVRLTLWYMGALAAILLVLCIGSYILLSRTLRERTDRSLADMADAFAAVLLDEEAELPGVPAPVVAAEAASEFRYAERRVFLYTLDGQLVVASEPPGARTTGAALTLPQLAASRVRAGLPDSVPRFLTVAAGGHPVRFVLRPARLHVVPHVAVAAGSLADERILQRRLGVALLTIIPAALLLAAAGGYVLARAALAPVAAMGRDAAAISAHNLHARLSLANRADELGALGAVFNNLLDRLERAFSQQRRFMADASHELRTPLAIVRGEADVALSREDRDIPALRESLQLVAREGRRLSRIVDDLFTLARADAGQHPLLPSDFYLDELVAGCAYAYRSIAAARGVRLHCTASEEIPFRGDEELLRRMVLNLLDNAAKHTPSGGVVELVLDRAGDALRMRIRDSGSGVPAEARPHVFERFYRADPVRGRERDQGAGLGLPIARWIAEAHGGSLELASTSAAGSEFVARLPSLPGDRPQPPKGEDARET